jgi:hypothetical protein
VKELPVDVIRACERYGRDLAEHYARGGSPQSRAVSSHGAESNPELLCDSKIGECIGALDFGLDPKRGVKWIADHPDDGYDLLDGQTRIDVKQCPLHYRYLIWPLYKNGFFDDKKFDVLVLVKTEIVRIDGEVVSARGYCRGWIGKATFRAKRLIAPADHVLDEGTRHMHEQNLHRMGIFPGRSDDPREHYCWCGEWGTYGASARHPERPSYCLKHRPPTQGSLFR